MIPLLLLAFPVFLDGLRSPDGLALGPDGTVYVAEETAGKVTGITPDGVVFTLMQNLHSPEGVAWHPEHGVLVVEDVPRGRLMSSASGVLAESIPNPEGVAVGTEGMIYITWARIGGPTGILRWTPGGTEPVLALPRGFMLSGLTAGPDGMLYACNEMPFSGLLVSVIRVNPVTGAWWPYAGGIPSAEGLRFAPDGTTLMVAAEETGEVIAVTPEGETSVFASGLGYLEDLLFLPDGTLLVTDDDQGRILKVPWP